jgi:hypothetical protein
MVATMAAQTPGQTLAAIGTHLKRLGELMPRGERDWRHQRCGAHRTGPDEAALPSKDEKGAGP